MENRVALSAGTLKGDKIRNMQGEDLGTVEEIMLDVNSGCVSYVVMSHGGFLGMGDKYFAIPWQAMTLDMDNHEFVLDMSLAQFEEAPGFDKTNWPDFSSEDYGRQIYSYYGVNYPSWFSGTGMTGAGVGTPGAPMEEGFGRDFDRERMPGEGTGLREGGTFGEGETFGRSGTFGEGGFREGESFREGEGIGRAGQEFGPEAGMLDCEQPGLTEEERQRCEEERMRAA